jgi:hypothetical protein
VWANARQGNIVDPSIYETLGAKSIRFEYFFNLKHIFPNDNQDIGLVQVNKKGRR